MRIHRKKYLCASVTLEATWALFLFFLFFIILLSFYSILNLEMRMQSALEQTADLQCMYATLMNINQETKADMRSERSESDGEDEDKKLSEILSVLSSCNLDQFFVKTNIIRVLGKAYLEKSWITGGSSGLNFQQSSFLEDGCTLKLIVVYRISIPFWNVNAFTITQQTQRRIWCGDVITDPESKTQAYIQEETVYITPNGEVYHLFDTCSYLKVHLQKVSFSQVELLRNEDGEKYYPCKSCNPEDAEMVYITAYGNRYHVSGECQAIEKNIQSISRSQAGERRLCSKCSEKAGVRD